MTSHYRIEVRAHEPPDESKTAEALDYAGRYIAHMLRSRNIPTFTVEVMELVGTGRSQRVLWSWARANSGPLAEPMEEEIR